MTTVLKSSIQAFNDQVLNSLKSKYPDAVIKVEVAAGTNISRMDETNFWEVIDCLDWHQKDRKQILQPAVERLSRYPIEEIYAFHNLLAQKLYALDGRQFAVRLGSNRYLDNEDRYFSVDDFLYSRCGVVARGKDYYNLVLQNPGRMPKEFTFEPLLSLPRKAYQLKTGLTDYNHITDVWYETFSNPDGWPGDKTLKDVLLDS